VLDNPELMALTLPVLRADFAIAGSYECAARRSIRCPIHAFGGTTDEPTSETLLAWKEHTSGDFWLNMLPGGHFFLHDQEAELLRLVQLRLQALLNPARPFKNEADRSGYAHGPSPR
jgi:surfactin synthase thioesterase subunit